MSDDDSYSYEDDFENTAGSNLLVPTPLEYNVSGDDAKPPVSRSGHLTPGAATPSYSPALSPATTIAGKPYSSSRAESPERDAPSPTSTCRGLASTLAPSLNATVSPAPSEKDPTAFTGEEDDILSESPVRRMEDFEAERNGDDEGKEEEKAIREEGDPWNATGAEGQRLERSPQPPTPTRPVLLQSAATTRLPSGLTLPFGQRRDDDKRRIRPIDLKQIELERKEAAINAAARSNLELAVKKEALEMRAAEFALREQAQLTMDKKERSIVTEERKLERELRSYHRMREHLEASKERFGKRREALTKTIAKKAGWIAGWRERVEEMERSAEQRQQRLAADKTEEKARAVARTNSMAKKEMALKKEQAKLATDKAALQKQLEEFRTKEREWAVRERYIKEQQAVVDKIRRELKWKEEDYTTRRCALKALQREYFSTQHLHETLMATIAREKARLNRWKYDLELQSENTREAVQALEADASKLAERDRALHEQLRGQEEQRQQQCMREAELLSRQAVVEEQAARAAEMEETLNRLEDELARERKGLEEKEATGRRLEGEVGELLEEIRWREGELTGVPALRERKGDQAHDEGVEQAAIDPAKGLVHLQMAKAKTTYLAALDDHRSKSLGRTLTRRAGRHHCDERPSPLDLTVTTTESAADAEEVASLAATFVAAMGQLRGLDPENTSPDVKAMAQIRSFDRREVNRLQYALRYERMIKGMLSLLSLLESCPLDHASSGCTARELSVAMTAWWERVKKAIAAREHSLLMEKGQALRMALAILMNHLPQVVRNARKNAGCTDMIPSLAHLMQSGEVQQHDEPDATETVVDTCKWCMNIMALAPQPRGKPLRQHRVTDRWLEMLKNGPSPPLLVTSPNALSSTVMSLSHLSQSLSALRQSTHPASCPDTTPSEEAKCRRVKRCKVNKRHPALRFSSDLPSMLQVHYIDTPSTETSPGTA
eukprot:Sspe_Gene.47023::Locus_23707_Transcript_1_1_Confidence_1.000_Length_3038::g.47023::m.47023